jgi:hypothetical protein
MRKRALRRVCADFPVSRAPSAARLKRSCRGHLPLCANGMAWKRGSSGFCVLLRLHNVPRPGTPSPDPWHFALYASSRVVGGSWSGGLSRPRDAQESAERTQMQAAGCLTDPLPPCSCYWPNAPNAGGRGAAPPSHREVRKNRMSRKSVDNRRAIDDTLFVFATVSRHEPGPSRVGWLRSCGKGMHLRVSGSLLVAGAIGCPEGPTKL